MRPCLATLFNVLAVACLGIAGCGRLGFDGLPIPTQVDIDTPDAAGMTMNDGSAAHTNPPQMPMLCLDGLLNGDETDVDCGGSSCTGCGQQEMCTQHSDCLSNFCKDDLRCGSAACEADESFLVTSLSQGNEHNCAVRSDGTLWCWGDNEDGQLGLGLPVGPGTERNSPTQVLTLDANDSDWTVVGSTLVNSSLAIRGDGTLWTWGLNDSGQLGLADLLPRNEPMQLGTATTWRHAAMGGDHACGIHNDGSLWCWGENGDGQLGLGDKTDWSSPQQVTWMGLNWQSVALGAIHSCAIDSAGLAYCWGYGEFGQLGDGSNTLEQLTPSAVSGAFLWNKLVAGNRFNCGIQTNETLWCWGRNEEGQLGQGIAGSPATDQNTPVQVLTDTWLDVSVGSDHACGIKTNGTLWCWGDNNRAQVGTGATSPNEPTPLQVGDEAWWTGVFLSRDSSCATRSDRSIWCWGENDFGELGLGNQDLTLEPQAVCL